MKSDNEKLAQLILLSSKVNKLFWKGQKSEKDKDNFYDAIVEMNNFLMDLE